VTQIALVTGSYFEGDEKTLAAFQSRVASHVTHYINSQDDIDVSKNIEDYKVPSTTSRFLKASTQPRGCLLTINDENHLMIPIASIGDSNQKDNLSAALSLMIRILRIPKARLKIRAYKGLGTSWKYSATYQTVLTELAAAVYSTTGITGPDRVSLGPSKKVSLGESLALAKLYRRYGFLFKRADSKNKKKGFALNLPNIKRAFLGAFDITSRADNPMAWIIAETIFDAFMHENMPLPGVFRKALNTRVGTSKVQGIFAYWGMKNVTPSYHKLRTVFRVEFGETSGRLSFAQRSEAREALPTDKKHMYAALRVLLMFSEGGKIPSKKVNEIVDDPVYIICQYWKTRKDILDAINLAYAVTMSLVRKKSQKTRPSHIHNAIGLMNKAINRKLIGRKAFDFPLGGFNSFNDIPARVLNAAQVLTGLTVSDWSIFRDDQSNNDAIEEVPSQDISSTSVSDQAAGSSGGHSLSAIAE